MLNLSRVLALGLLSACVVIPAHAQNADVSAIPVPETYFPELKPILEAAVRQSPKMIARNLENTIAEQSRIAARAGQLPTAGAFVTYNPFQRDKREDLPEPTNTKKLFYNFSVTQPLFHWGALRNNTRIGELQQKVTQGQTAEVYRLLVQEIRSLYLQLVLKKLLVSRSQLNLEINRDKLAIAQTKFEKRVFSESDMFSPRLNHDQAQLAFDRVTMDYEDTKVTLAKLTGSPALTDDQIATAIPTVTPATDLLKSVFSAHSSPDSLDSYNLQNLRSQLEIEKLNYKIASVRLLPKTNLLVGASQDEQSYTSNIAAKYKLQSTYAGVQVSWSIFDGFAARSAKAISLARRQQIEHNYEDATTNLADSLRTQLRQLEFSARGMEMANRVLGVTEGGWHSKQDDVKRGIASDADVSAAKLSFIDAQVGAFNSRFDYLMKTTDFLSSMLQDPALANLSKANP